MGAPDYSPYSHANGQRNVGHFHLSIRLKIGVRFVKGSVIRPSPLARPKIRDANPLFGGLLQIT
jgi:hypothetical protein